MIIDNQEILVSCSGSDLRKSISTNIIHISGINTASVHQ